jgi:hypothetical protein
MTDEEKLLWMFEQVHAEKDALYRTIKKLRDENEEHLHAIETWKDEVKILECECNAAKQKVSAGKRIILTGKEIKALAEFVGLDVVNHHPICEETLEAEIVISEKEEAGRKYKLAHFYDYPDETCIDLNDF